MCVCVCYALIIHFLRSGQLIHSYDNANAQLLNIEYSSHNDPLITIFPITEITVSLQLFLQNTYVYYFYLRNTNTQILQYPY